MRRKNFTLVAIVIIAVCMFGLSQTSTAFATQAITTDVTYHGIHDKKGGCIYTISAPANTHGKSIHSDLASCTMVMERKPGPAPDAPKGGVAGPKKAFNTAAGGTDPTSQGHVQVWTWDVDGQADDSVFAYLTWSWNGWSVTGPYAWYWGKWWANNDGSGVSWDNNWYNDYFNSYFYQWNSNEVMSYSTARFYTDFITWNGDYNIYDTYNYVAFHGYGNGDFYCNWSVDQNAFGNGIGYICTLDWVN